MNWKALFLSALLPLVSLDAAWTLKNGRLHKSDELATLSPEEHFQLGLESFEAKEWEEAAHQFRVVSFNFPNSQQGETSLFYLGVSLYYQGELEEANRQLSSYLEMSNPQYFQEAFDYKFAVAEKFRKGAKARLLGYSKMPKLSSGKEIALSIYDEIIQTLGNQGLSSKALFAKGLMLMKDENFDIGIDTFITFIKKFPKHELTPNAFLRINQLYYLKAQKEQQNSDLVYLAESNARRFKERFPKDERVKEAEDFVAQIQEVYANGLYELGLFYERCGHPKASILYYETSAEQFPQTACASKCLERLKQIKP
ncbi:MAG: hypothetical protein K0S07_1603 [Chlamydiales bacterium]|jgi:outer membrane protein assembly factor BamD (BamD/ComL family)|nr:hypothetical protein [Chlamydiales bacterium]